jgi:hypothetical protein
MPLERANDNRDAGACGDCAMTSAGATTFLLRFRGTAAFLRRFRTGADAASTTGRAALALARFGLALLRWRGVVGSDTVVDADTRMG